MTREMTDSDRLDRVRRLVVLYQRRIITGTSLINDVAECVTSTNVDEIVSLLPQDIRPRLIKWIKQLPDPSSKEMVVWPMPNCVALSFKEWLRKHEAEVEH